MKDQDTCLQAFQKELDKIASNDKLEECFKNGRTRYGTLDYSLIKRCNFKWLNERLPEGLEIRDSLENFKGDVDYLHEYYRYELHITKH